MARLLRMLLAQNRCRNLWDTWPTGLTAAHDEWTMLKILTRLFPDKRAKAPTAFEQFDQTYLTDNPDVASAVARGDFKTGAEHWLIQGAKEGRLYGHLVSSEAMTPVLQQLETLRANLQASQNRIDQLEALLVEHPAFASRGRLNVGFPSPAVSIVMPTWNRANIVSDAISSVLAQRYTDWELIIVDDGSADETAAVIATFLHDKRIRYEYVPHGGQSRARNVGMQLARGELIAYLDSDNLWYPDFLYTAVTAFAADDGLDVAYGALVSDVHLKDRKLLFEPFDRARLLQGNFIPMTTLVHRRRLAERCGGFDENLEALEDWDLILKYTEHKPALAIPVIASRCRVVDEKRVSDSNQARLASAFDLIRSKWIDKNNT